MIRCGGGEEKPLLKPRGKQAQVKSHSNGSVCRQKGFVKGRHRSSWPLCPDCLDMTATNKALSCVTGRELSGFQSSVQL